jgi:hypothetical protein
MAVGSHPDTVSEMVETAASESAVLTIPERHPDRYDSSSFLMRTPSTPRHSVVPFLSLWILASMGIGMLCGFGILYRFWWNACEQILIDYQKNSTLSVLDIQHAAVSRQEALLQSYRETLQKLSQITDQKDAAMKTIQDLQRQVETTERDKMQQEKRLEQKYENMRQQLELSRIMLREKLELVEKLKEQNQIRSDHRHEDVWDHRHDHSSKEKDEEQIIAIQTSIRQFAYANLLQTYGLLSDTPNKESSSSSILVEFWIRDTNPKSATSSDITTATSTTTSFQIEIKHAQIQQTPHTIYTFLDLIKRGLYHETTISTKSIPEPDVPTNTTMNTTWVVGTFPSSKHSKWIRKYAENGYQIPPVWFSETSTWSSSSSSCQNPNKLVVTMKHRGPEFQIHHGTSNSDNYNHNDSGNYHSVCLGTIVKSEANHDDEGPWASIVQATIIDARVLHPTMSTRDQHQRQKQNHDSEHGTQRRTREEL